MKPQCNIGESLREQMKKFQISCIMVLLVSSLPLFNCEKDKTTQITNSSDDSNTNNLVEIEKQKIVNTYLQWSQRLIAQNYEGAIALIEKDSAAVYDMNYLKGYWDDGEAAYYSFSNVQAIIDQPLRYGMGWAQGDATIVTASRTLTKKFTSSCIRENSQWLISAIHFQ